MYSLLSPSTPESTFTNVWFLEKLKVVPSSLIPVILNNILPEFTSAFIPVIGVVLRKVFPFKVVCTRSPTVTFVGTTETV
jgi:hypothetical protein